jgi:branched-chain amino acid transport system permease protein
LRTFVGIYTEYWTMILGILLILLIFFLPEGVMGLFLRKVRKRGYEEEGTGRGQHAQG